MRHVTVGLLVGLASVPVAGQAPVADSPRFEVASIKPSPPDANGTAQGTLPGGRWIMRNMAVSVMIRAAYPAQAPDLIGAPDWVTSEAYDVETRAAGNPTRDQVRLMLQTLLRERFKLEAHYETHERPVYALVVAREDGDTPAALKRSTIDCEAVTAARDEGRTPNAPEPTNGAPLCGWGASYGGDAAKVSFGGAPLSRLGQGLSTVLGERIVIDRTGLTGGYEFTLTFNPEPSVESDSPSVFTALEEQLGLKLVPDRAPLQVLAIDHIERPTPN